MNGIVNIYKEAGLTSFSVCSRVKKILNVKKTGHTGTLDPEATGVLPICVGNATKAAGLLTAADKEYKTTIKFGIKTDSQDIFGKILEQKEVFLEKDKLLEAAKAFTGKIMQLPPMYSAIKQGGKKLYEYARKGIEVEREKREVNIYYINVLEFNNDEAVLGVGCSKGTYIRTLCADIGEYLNTVACMKSLERTKSGRFTLETSITLDKLKAMVEDGENPLLPVDEVFFEYDKITLSEKEEFKVKNGVMVPFGKPLGTYRVYGSRNDFLCIGEIKDISGDRFLKVTATFFGG